MPNFKVVDEQNPGNLSAEGYRAIVEGIITNATGFSEYDSAPSTGNSGNAKPDILQRLARAHHAVVIREPPAGGDEVVSGRTADIKNEKDGFDGNKSKVAVPLPRAPIPEGGLAYLNQYLKLLVSELGAAGGITHAGGNFAFNPNGPGVPEVRKLLFGMMILTRCR